MEINWNELLSYKLAGNPVKTYMIAVTTFFVSLVIMKLIKGIGLKQIKKISDKTKNNWDDFVVNTIEKNSFYFTLVISLYIAGQVVNFKKDLENVFVSIFIIILTLVSVKVIIGLLTFWFEEKYKKSTEDLARASTVKNVVLFLKAFVWVSAVLFILDNLGFNITTAVAGLGIGGMALALASQAIFADLFSYFVIAFDKPFEVGDYISLGGDLSGTVEHVGIKTTRIRNLYGDVIVASNSDLTGSRVRNFKKMQKRRIAFSIGITYETPLEKVKKVPALIQSAIESQDQVQFDRSHFASFGDFSLNFDTVYYVNDRDYALYMEIQQGINLALAESFEKEGIDFAYPTQQLYVTKTA